MPSSASTRRRHSLRRSTARKTATANDSDDNADDDVTDNDGSDGVAAADADGPADTYAAANDVASLTDCRQHDESAAAVDDKKDYDDGDCDEGDSESDGGNDGFVADGTVVDEDVNVAAAVVPVGTAVSEDGREPLPLLIRAPPPRELLVSLLLSKQVRGPVREVEESEYDWEEDP